MQFHRWDAVSLPLPDESVSVAVTNLPFGRRVRNHETNVELYPRLVQEIWRILRTGGRAVLLTQEVALLRNGGTQPAYYLFEERKIVDDEKVQK